MGQSRKFIRLVAPVLAIGAVNMPPIAGLAQPVLPQGASYYVKATSLQCRAEPNLTARVLTRLPNAAAVRVLERRGEWWQLSHERDPLCWAKSEFLTVSASDVKALRVYGAGGSTASRPAALSSRPLPLTSSPSAVSAPRRSVASTTSRPRRTDQGAGSGCPCSGSRVCIGPRGGRYCITSGGNKRYGV
jgi:hypothetical protein